MTILFPIYRTHFLPTIFWPVFDPKWPFSWKSKINSVTIDFRKLYSTWAYGCFVRSACPIIIGQIKETNQNIIIRGHGQVLKALHLFIQKIELFKINFIRSITQHLIRRESLTFELVQMRYPWTGVPSHWGVIQLVQIHRLGTWNWPVEYKLDR